MLWSLWVLALWTVTVLSVDLPNTYLWNPQTLYETKQRVLKKDPLLDPAVKNLQKNADSALSKGPWTVMNKKVVPPSGSKHDYYSLAIYWWPCNWNDTNFDYDFGDYPPKWFAECNKKTGLPWVRRDGVVDPLTSGGDPVGLSDMVDAVTKLSLGYYFFNDEKYAARVNLILKTWFWDTPTKMNPNLNYGQGVPGVISGRPEGIIEAKGFINLVNAVVLLNGSQSWSKSDDQQLKEWFSSYLEWMQTSKIGMGESAATNNHGTWYDTQASAIALYIGKKDLAATIAKGALKRVDIQVEPNGTLPKELARTNSFHYSYFDIEAFFYLATLTPYSSVNLFKYSSSDGRSLRKAFDFLVPYATHAKKWPYQQISPMNTGVFFQQFRMASIVWNDTAYETDITKLPNIDYTGDYGVDLLYPKQ